MTVFAMDVRELSFEEVDFVYGGGKKPAPKPAPKGDEAGGDNADFADQLRDVADFIVGFIEGWKEKD